MSDTVKQLIHAIVVAARARGLTQKALAENAGLTAVGLSKAKHRGDIRASTLAALAGQVDLQLTLAPAHTREKTVEAIRAGSFFGSRPAQPDERD